MAVKKDHVDDGGVKEAFRGLYAGVGMMIIAFLILHFIFDIKMFQ